MKNNVYDVIIAGGGMAGMSMAVALARESLNVAVIERGLLQVQHLPAPVSHALRQQRAPSASLWRCGWRHSVAR